jgi:hypothetical protein
MQQQGFATKSRKILTKKAGSKPAFFLGLNPIQTHISNSGKSVHQSTAKASIKRRKEKWNEYCVANSTVRGIIRLFSKNLQFLQNHLNIGSKKIK